jgi:hypothetical protein
VHTVERFVRRGARIGNRGYGALAAVFLGSFTFRLLQIAQCPVLVVPTGGRQRAA